MKPGELLRSSTFRVILSYMALFAGSVLLLLGFIYWSTIAFMANQTDQSIKTEIAWLTGLYNDHGLGGLVSTINKRSSRYRNDQSYYAISSQDERLLAGNIPLRFNLDTGKEGWSNIEVKQPRSSGNFIQLRVRSAKLSGGELLLVGRDMRQFVVSQQLIVPALLWGLVIMMVLAILGGVLMSRSVLRHIEAINLTVREIMAGDLSRRIPTRNSNDDFDHLARNLNAMLDEIVRLMDGIKQVSNNVAHDLRTPLTRLRNKLETLKSELNGDQSQMAHVEAGIASADQLLSTFSALLRIARLEAGGLRGTLQLVDVNVLFNDIAELYVGVADEKNIAISMDGLNELDRDTVFADRDLLFQAIANLLDNAIKYTQEGGQIILSFNSSRSHADISVIDNGPGIPTAEHENVLQRFYRLEGSRTSAGNGLGLSLVSAIARAHKGELIFSENKPGLIATLRMKSSFSAPSP